MVDTLHLPYRPAVNADQHMANLRATEDWARRIKEVVVALQTDVSSLQTDVPDHGTADHSGGAKPHAVIGPWGNRNPIGASANNLQLGLTVSEASSAGTVPESSQMPVVMDRPGSIVGIAVALHFARTGGTLTCEVWKNGVATGLTVVIDGTNTQYHATAQAWGLDPFVAGDRLDIRESTDASWAPSANNLLAWLTVAYD